MKRFPISDTPNSEQVRKIANVSDYTNVLSFVQIVQLQLAETGLCLPHTFQGATLIIQKLKNTLLKEFCENNCTDTISYDNINVKKHLNKGKLHLNDKGISSFVTNFRDF